MIFIRFRSAGNLKICIWSRCTFEKKIRRTQYLGFRRRRKKLTEVVVLIQLVDVDDGDR